MNNPGIINAQNYINSSPKKLGDLGSSYWNTRKPSNIVLLILSETSIKVNWTDAAAAAQGIKVYFNDVLKATVAYGVGTTTITGLTVDTEYTVKVVAYKSTNESDPITATATTGIAAFKTTLQASAIPKVTGNDSTFAGAGNWVTGLGSLQPDLSTYPGEMYLNFTSSNQAVKLPNTLDTTNKFLIRVKAKKVSGTGMPVSIGKFAASLGTSGFLFTPVAASQYFYGYIYGQPDANLYIGAITANNNGTKISIEEVECWQVNPDTIIDVDYEKMPLSNGVANLFGSLNKSDKTLVKFGVIGDSIMANSIGGSIPVGSDEGDTMRPPRLVTNNVPRRLWDKYKYNVPIFRRLDHAAWTKSTLSGSNDFTEMLLSYSGTYRTPFAPGGGDKYFRTGQSGAYCEIVIPDGMENFALIYRINDYADYAGTIPMDDQIAVTINGGDISTYGLATINELTADFTESANALGYGLNIAEYNNLPAGNNTIRFTKSANTDEFHLWGVMYWHGNTMAIINAAYGGLSLDGMQYQDESIYYKNTHDAVLFQFPTMNNCSEEVTMTEHLQFFIRVLNGQHTPENTLFFAPHPMGINPASPATNYYTQYANPTQLNSTKILMYLAVLFGFKFIDTFKYFRNDVVSKGGTLEGGQAGNYYTDDGMHPDEEGTAYYEDFLIDLLPAAIPD